MAYGYPEDYDGADKGERAAQLVFKARKDSQEAFRPLREKKWRRAHLFYFGKHDLTMFEGNKGKYPWSSKLFLPTPLQQIETIAPRLAAGLLADDNYVSVTPAMAANDAELDTRFVNYAKAVEVLLHNQLVQDVRLGRQLPMWARDGLIYGTKWLYTGWKRRVGKRWGQVEQGDGTDKWKWQVKDQHATLIDRIDVTGESIWDINPDPNGTTVENCAFIQRERDMSVDDLWAWIQGTWQLPWKVRTRKELTELVTSGKGKTPYRDTMREEVGRFDTGYGSGSNGRGAPKVHLIDHYEDDHHILVAGREGGPHGVLLLEPNPTPGAGKPFVRIVPTPLDGELYGMGLIEMIEQLVHQANSLTNLRMVNIVRATNMTGLVNTMSGLTAQKMMNQPAQFYNVNGAVQLDNCVKTIDWPVVNNDSRYEVDATLEQIRTTGGAQEPTMGQADPSNRTARGIQSMIEQGAVRTAQMVHNVAESLRDMCVKMHLLDRQYMDSTRQTRALTPEGRQKWMTVDPRMLDRDYVLEFNCRPEAANKQAMLQSFTNMLNIFGQWEELDRAHAIKTGIKLTGMAEPLAFLKQQTGDAEGENAKWRAVGRMPDVHPADNHAYHRQVHMRIKDAGEERMNGPQAEQELRQHVMMHLQYEFGPSVAGGGQAQPAQAPGAPSMAGRMAASGQPPPAPEPSGPIEGEPGGFAPGGQGY